MRILHYFLGFPPYRTGGLTKYSVDLMLGQLFQNNIVMALWPGNMGVVFSGVTIRKRKSVKGIENYELINPLPISLDEGITEFDKYMKPCDASVYVKFLKKVKPDVVHIHTLMGLHREFLDATAELGIRTVFTTHDYYGLCPKVTLYKCGGVCDDDHGCRDCIQCNYSALSLNKIRVMQSTIYRLLKNSMLIKYMRQRHRKNFFSNEVTMKVAMSEKEQFIKAEKYKELRKYYVEMLEHMDIIHFNSTIAEEIYCKYFTPKSSKVISITHQNIEDNRSYIHWSPGKVLRMTYLGSVTPFKGFTVLKNALDELWDSGKRDFELSVFAPVEKLSPYMKVKESGYQYSELPQIFADSDVLIAPSIWYETFGFTVLEAISYGVPVILSDHVGAKDIVGNGGIIVKAGSVASLKEVLLSFNVKKQLEMRNIIKKDIEIKTWQYFLEENYSLYKD